ncbi:unnamed protein product [Closterium sp. NIES-54]
MIVFVTFLREHAVTTEFPTSLSVEKCDAASLYAKITGFLDSISLPLEKVAGISTDGAPVMIGNDTGLVGRLRLKIPHMVASHCIAHREALVAKEVAKALPELGIIDAVIRTVAEDLGRSSNSNRNRGDAIARFVRVLPAVIVMLEESDKTMYHLVTSFKFHYFLFFLADVHMALNALNLLFQKRQVDLTAVHSQVRRTIIYMEQRYLNCGQQFGGGTSELLSAFLARHASPDCREVTVEGVDKEGQPRVHKFQLHEEAVKGYTTSSGDMQGCYTCCRSFARELVYSLELRLGDLTRLNGANLFMPRSWPRGVEARDAECKEHLHGLVHLFQAKNRDTILPGFPTSAAAAADSSSRRRRQQQPPPPLPCQSQPPLPAAAPWPLEQPPLLQLPLAPGAAALAAAASGPWSSSPCSSREALAQQWQRPHHCRCCTPALLATGEHCCYGCYCCSCCYCSFYCYCCSWRGQMQLQHSPRESLAPHQLREWYASWGCRGGRTATTAPAALGGGQMQLQRRPRESLTPQQLREWYATWGCRRGRSGSRSSVSSLGAACSCQVQLQRSPRAVLSPQQLREWYVQRGGSRSTAHCPYVIRTGARTGQPCRTVDIYALDYDAILTAMYALPTSDVGDSYLCVPPDPGIEAAALGAGEAAALGASASDPPSAGESAAPGTGESDALGAGESAAPGAGESALSGTTSSQVLHTFTLDSGASRSFRDRTALTPLSRPVAVSLANPYGGPVLAHFSTVLPCPAAPSGLYLPSFSTNLVSGAHLQDAGADQFTQAPSRSGPESTPCSCRLLSHETLLWHHRLGHPSLPRLRGMASRFLVSGLPQSLPSLPLGPAPTCVPCVEGRQHAPPHSSEFPPTEAPLQTLHMDVWGPARVRGQGHKRYFLLVVDGYSRYTTVFPLRSKGEVIEVLIDWIRAARLQLRESFGSNFPVLRLHSDRGGEFCSDLLRAFCRAKGIRLTFTLPASPQQNGIAEHRIGMVMDVARTSMIHAAAPHFLWPFAVQYAVHQINLQPRVSLLETSPTLRWTGKVGDASAFRFWGSRAFDVTFDELVPFYRLFPYCTAPLPPPPLFLTPAVDSKPVRVTEHAEPGGAGSGGTAPKGAEPGGAKIAGAEPGGAETAGAEPGGAVPGGVGSGGTEPGGAAPRGALSSEQLCEWYSRYSRSLRGAARAVGAGPAGGAACAAGGTGAAGAVGGTGAAGHGGAPGAGAAGGARAGGPTGVGAGGAAGAGASEGAGVGAAGAGGAAGVGTGGAAGAGASEGAGVGPVGAGGAAGAGAAAGGTGAVPAVSGGAARPRPYFVPLLEQVLGLPPSTGPAPPLECPQPDHSQSQLQPASPLPAPSPYTGPTGGLAERRAPASRPASRARAARTSRRVPRQRPPAVLGTHQMALRPSTAPQRSTAASSLVAELVDFTAHCRLDYAASLVAESESVCPPSVGGECALGTDVLEDRQEEFLCFSARLPHLVSMLIAPEGDPDAPDIPTPRSYVEAIEGPYSSQWQSAMDAEMASWRSTGTYVDEVPPRGANIVSGMWIFRVKRPPGSPPIFKAHYVARGFSQRQGVDFFQTSPTPKMTTLRVLLHIAAQRDYELHSLDFSTAFLLGSLHEEIWLRRPPGFTGSFPPGTQWSLQRPVYGFRQAPREWHKTLRTTLTALGFAPSTTDPSLFLRTNTSLLPFYILVYVDDLVFATADTSGLAHVKSEVQKRHTCTDLGELRSYLSLQITRDRAQRTITLNQSHMVQQVLQRFDFTYSSPQATPLSTRDSLSALPFDESVQPSGPYPELVGCLMYLMTCTGPYLAYPLSILAGYVATGRYRQEHMAAAKTVLRYLCTTLGSGSVSWRSTRSSSVLGSSCEAEIYAGAMAAQKLRSLTYLLTNLGELPRSPPVLYVDNKAMLALCREHRVEHRTKHIALRYFLARELQHRGQLRLAYVASEANTADIFTKALPPCDHQRCYTMLGLVPTWPHLLNS